MLVFLSHLIRFYSTAKDYMFMWGHLNGLLNAAEKHYEVAAQSVIQHSTLVAHPAPALDALSRKYRQT